MASLSGLRPSFGASHARILGIGGYRPARVVTNEEIAIRIDSSDAWIRSRSGIVERRWADPHETVAYMAAQAGGKALAEAGVTPDQVGCVMVATSTHFHQLPAVATEVAHLLVVAGAAAFDLSAACAGFTHGLALAGDMVRGGSAGYVLLIGSERMSDLIDRDDRGTAFLFADGAGAAVIGPSATPGLGPVVWGADGAQAGVIAQSASWQELRDDRERSFPALTMRGPAVFRWAVFEMAKACQEALDAAGITAADLDAFVPHQANLRIIDTLAKNLGLPSRVAIAREVTHGGNTSAASIPLAMDRLLATGAAPSGGLALTLGFGAGLSYAAQVAVLP